MQNHRQRAVRASLGPILAAALLATAGTALAQHAPAPASPEAAQTAALPAGVPAWSIAGVDIAPDPAVRFGVLPNGMRYALMHHEMPKGGAALRFSIDVGVRDESDAQMGSAHFVEHMAFNGSTNIPEGQLVPRLERLGLAFGADTNAETNVDFTTYKLDLPRTTDEIVDAGLMMMREVAGNLTIDPAAVDRERGIIQSESRVRNVPQRRRAADMLTTVLPGSAIGSRITIEPDEIAQTTAATLRDFYQRYYRPERATLVMVGDFDVAEMERKVRDRFADWQGTGTPAVDYTLALPSAAAPAIGAFSDPSVPEIIELRRVWDYTPPANSISEEREKLLQMIASLAITNRLNTLGQQPDTAILGGQAGREDLFRTAESFGVLVVAKDGEWRRALAVTEQAARQAAQFGFTQAEVDEAKANLNTALVNQVEQQAARQSAEIASQIVASSLQDSVYTSPETELAAFQAMAPSMTPAAVLDAFREAWGDGPTAIHVSTKAPIAQPQEAIAAVLQESAAVAVAAPVEDQAVAFAYENFGPDGAVVADSRIDDLGIRTVAFANGLQLNLKKTDFEPGKVAFLMEVGTGVSAFPRDTQGLGVMVGLATSIDGLEAHGIDELRRILAGRTVARGFGAAQDAIVAQGNTTPGDLKLQLQLLAASLTASGYRPETQTQWSTVAPVLAQNLAADPMQVLALSLDYAVTDGDARLGIGDPQALAALSVDDLKAVLEPQLKNGPVALALVGDFDEDAAIAAVASTLGALPQRPARDARRAAVTTTFSADRAPRVLHHAGGADQGAIALSWPTTDDSDFRSSMLRDVLAAVLQLRLTDTIREKLGATYGGSAGSVASYAFPGYGRLTAAAPSRPEDMAVIDETIRSIAADLAATPVSDDELLRARQPALELLDRQERTNAGWTSIVAFAQNDPERLDRRRQRKAIIQAITPADLQAAAKRWFGASEPLRVEVSPNEPSG